MSITFLIIILLLCILVEGFFSGSEMAVVKADKYKLALETDAGSKRALLALHLIKHPAKFFATTLLGTNISMVTGSVVATMFIINNYGDAYSPFALLLWPAILIFGEIVPKSIYHHHSDKLVLYVGPALFVFSVVFYPAVWVLSKLTNSLLGGVKRLSGLSRPITRDELETILEVGAPGTSDVRQSERTMISRIFDLADKKVENIMTPLVDVIALPVEASRMDVETVLEEYGFSRVPIYDGQAFNIIGVVDGTDLIFGAPTAGIRDLIKKVYYVPEEMPLDELLVAMKRKEEPISVVVDEYGAATGLVTVEDLLEEVVGEIRDEHDEQPTLYTRLGKHRFLLSGRLEIEEANERFKLNIPGGDYETIAGFVIHRFGHIPKAGKKFIAGEFEFVVARSTDRAVLEVEAARKTQ